VPIYTPAPQYPRSLLETGYTGKVRFYLTVDNDGFARHIRVVESAHPQLTESVRQVASRWRFKPWSIAGSNAGQTEVMLLVLFGAEGMAAFPPQISVGLGNTLCAYLNQEVALSRRDYPDAALSDVDVFSYTTEFLESAFVAVKLPEHNAREALRIHFKEAIPTVVAGCLLHPRRRYSDFLPEDVREALGWIRIAL
jgi:TonB family protein